MGLFSKIFHTESATPTKIQASDLSYAYLRCGSSWGSREDTWDMKNYIGENYFLNSWDRVQKLGLVEHASAEECLSRCTMDVLREFCKKYGIPSAKRKEDIVENILKSKFLDEISPSLSPCVALSEYGKGLLEKHHYLSYVLKHYKEFRFLNSYNQLGPYLDLMFKTCEKKPDTPPADIILKCVSEEDFYGEDCEEDSDMDAEDRRYMKKAQKEAEKEYWRFFEKVRADFESK